jgi:hypothetical protein
MKVEFFLRYRLSETLITLLTINASTFERYQEILSAGTQGFIQRPSTPATLSVKLKEVLEGK